MRFLRLLQNKTFKLSLFIKIRSLPSAQADLTVFTTMSITFYLLIDE